MSSQSDERLVDLARNGHERAFVAIVERYRPELQALARRLCSDGRSEDIVQQAFLSAFAALRAGSEVRHLRGWLYQIVRNAANRPQAPLCVPLDAVTATAPAVEDVVQERALAMTALTELARLPARQRQAMIGTVLDGRGRAEIASSMGLSEGAVRQLVHRARTTLRSAVTVVTPWPLARWIAAVRPNAPGTAELATGAGVATSGGLTIKLGALLASGTFLTGAAVVDLHQTSSPRAVTRAAVSGQVRAREQHGRLLAHDSTVPVVSATQVTPVVVRAPQSRSSRPGGESSVLDAGGRAVRVSLHQGVAAGPSDGGTGGGHDGGAGRTPGGSSGGERAAGGDGFGGSSLQASGSDGQRSGSDGQRSGSDGQRSGSDGQRSGSDGQGQGGSGANTSGGDGSGRDASSGAGSGGGGAAQMASASQSLGSTVDGSSSPDGFRTTAASTDGSSSGGDGSGSRYGGASESGDGGSGSGGGSTSGSGGGIPGS